RPRRPVKTADLKAWAASAAGIPDWLFEASYHIVGDLAEAIALMLPPQVEHGHAFTLPHVVDDLAKLAMRADTEKKDIIASYWQHLEQDERFVFNKLITGNFRMGVSRQLVIKALAIHLGMDEAAVAHRLMGKWMPTEETMASLFAEPGHGERDFQPYPFYLAYQLDSGLESLGDLSDWYIEKKLDGIRGQLIVRNGRLFVWSRGEDLLTDKFPECAPLAESLPDGTVVDGEIIPWQDGQPLPFQVMQTRIVRQNLSPTPLRAAPLMMVCDALVTRDRQAVRTKRMPQRRDRLEVVRWSTPGPSRLRSEAMAFRSWSEVARVRERARECHGEGVMLERNDSPYGCAWR